MPVTVHIPTRIRVDPGALQLRRGCVESALTAAATRALKNSRDVVLDRRGGYVDIEFHAPVFTWSGNGLVQVPLALRSLVEQSVTQTLLQTAQDIGLCDVKKEHEAADHPLPKEASQPFRKNEKESRVSRYLIPSYQEAGTKVSVPFKEQPVSERTAYVWKEIHSHEEWQAALDEQLDFLRIKIPTTGYFGVTYWFRGSQFIYVRQFPSGQILFDTGIELKTWKPNKDKTGLEQIPIQNPASTSYRVSWFADIGSDDHNFATMKRAFADELKEKLSTADPKLSRKKIAEIVDMVLWNEAKGIDKSLWRSVVRLMIGEVPGYITLSVSVPHDLDVELLTLGTMVELPPGIGEGEGGALVDTDLSQSTQESSSKTGERGCFKFNVFDTSEDDEYCGRFRGEPRLSELGDSVNGISSLMDEIAGKLGISTCDFAGRFCVRAAEAIYEGAGRVGYNLQFSEIAGQLEASPKGTGNLKSAELTLSRTPAVNALRDLAAITPRLTILSGLVRDIYDQVGRSNRRDCPSEVGSWLLHFTIDKNDVLGPAIARIFKQACRSVLLQLLYATRKSILDRQARVALLAEVFKATVLPLLLTIDDLLQLRERLKKARTELAQRAPGLSYVLMAHHEANESAAARLGLSEDIVVDGLSIQGIKDKQGTVWTDESLEATIVLRRGVAEELDPVVKHIFDLPDVVARLRQDPNQTETEISSVLDAMKSKNLEFIDKTRNSENFAFGMTKIIETNKSENIQIPNTSYALQGFHKMAHEQIGDAFEGDWSYAYGVKYLFDAELGFEELTSIGEFVGIVALSVICPPLGFAAGVGAALLHYAEAKEKERFYDAFMDPEEFISRAEIEAELFGAKLGLVLSFIPEAGNMVRGGIKGVKLVAEEGAVSAVRSAARAAARKALEEMAEKLAKGLVTELVKELVKAEILNKVLSLFIEPVIRAVEREASITGPVGGLDEAASTLQRLHLNLPSSTEFKESTE